MMTAITITDKEAVCDGCRVHNKPKSESTNHGLLCQFSMLDMWCQVSAFLRQMAALSTCQFHMNQGCCHVSAEQGNGTSC